MHNTSSNYKIIYFKCDVITSRLCADTSYDQTCFTLVKFIPRLQFKIIFMIRKNIIQHIHTSHTHIHTHTYIHAISYYWFFCTNGVSLEEYVYSSLIIHKIHRNLNKCLQKNNIIFYIINSFFILYELFVCDI